MNSESEKEQNEVQCCKKGVSNSNLYSFWRKNSSVVTGRTSFLLSFLFAKLCYLETNSSPIHGSKEAAHPHL